MIDRRMEGAGESERVNERERALLHGEKIAVKVTTKVARIILDRTNL